MSLDPSLSQPLVPSPREMGNMNDRARSECTICLGNESLQKVLPNRVVFHCDKEVQFQHEMCIPCCIQFFEKYIKEMPKNPQSCWQAIAHKVSPSLAEPDLCANCPNCRQNIFPIRIEIPEAPVQKSKNREMVQGVREANKKLQFMLKEMMVQAIDQEDVVKAEDLLEATNFSDIDKEASITIAAQTGKSKILKILLEKWNPTNNLVKKAFDWAIKETKPQILEQLLPHLDGLNLGIALIRAAQANNPQIVALLLTQGERISSEDRQLAQGFAEAYNNPEMIPLFNRDV